MLRRKKSHFFVTLSIFIIPFLSLPTAKADCGLIPYEESPVFEPGQQAIIAWNEEEEVLILSVDVFASEQTSALQIFPLPAQPTIRDGNIGSFFAIQQLIWQNQRSPFDSSLGGGSFNENSEAGIEITFHETIGSHDITVVKINNANGAITWVQDFLESKGIHGKILPSNLDGLVSRYVNEDIRFFVFDVVDLAQQPRSVEPMVYRFKSDYLYFPLRISTIIDGQTNITLLTLSEFRLDDRPMKQLGFKKSYEFDVGGWGLQNIDKDVASLFGQSAHFVAYTYSGPIDSFDGDVKLVKLVVWRTFPFILGLTLGSILSASIFIIAYRWVRKKDIAPY